MKSIYSKLLILMTLSLSVGYSQDTTIELELQVARLVIEDLVKGDQAKEELFLSKEQIEVLESKVSLKDSIINKKNDIILNYEGIIGKRSEQLQTSKELSTKLQQSLKKQKAKTRLFQLGSGVVVVMGGLLLL